MTRIAYAIIGTALAAGLYVLSTRVPEVGGELKMLASFVLGLIGFQFPTKAAGRGNGSASKLYPLLLLSLLPLTQPVASGCAGFPKVLADITKVVLNVMDAVDIAERFAVEAVYPVTSDDVDKQLSLAFLAVRQIAAGVEAGTHTAEQLYAAYDSMLRLLKGFGVAEAGSGLALAGGPEVKLVLPSAEQLIPLEG